MNGQSLHAFVGNVIICFGTERELGWIISYALLHYKLPKNLKHLKTMHAYYIRVSAAQQYRHKLPGVSASGPLPGCHAGVTAGVSSVALT